MKFTPRTEAELAESNLWPEGEYPFEVLEQVNFGGTVLSTTDTISKNSGAEMIQLVLKVLNNEGRFITIIDYLLESMEFKLRHAAEACGLLGKYESGDLVAEDFRGKQGFLKLRKGKARDGYQPRNEVKDYVVPDEGAEASQAQAPLPRASLPLIDDEIPF